MQEIREWLDGTEFGEYSIEVASEDASFRRYFRLTKEKITLILMDSSLEKESLVPFMDITVRLLDAGVHAPRILLADVDKGFLILEDLGNVQLLDALQPSNYLHFYSMALEEILKMQQAEAAGLPLYDKAFLTFEMELMQEWFLEQYVDIDLSHDDTKVIENTLDYISDEVLKQPQGYFVHRDFHSRNIMVGREDLLGVIDYQDAMRGSITYDLVSLLRDLYIELPKPLVEQLVLAFRDIVAPDIDDATFMRWFDFMGLQRHIKVLGIFARLYLRDGKDGYLNDLPLTLKYTRDILAKYDETKALHTLLQEVVLP